MTPLKYSGLVAGILFLCIACVISVNADTIMPDVQGNLSFRITDDGITGGADMTAGGLYIVTVNNDSLKARGLVIEGVDLCCSPYTRFTKVLQPGQQITFRWYFPSNRDVKFRDLLVCKQVATTCGAFVIGGFSRAMTFS